MESKKNEGLLKFEAMIQSNREYDYVTNTLEGFEPIPETHEDVIFLAGKSRAFNPATQEEPVKDELHEEIIKKITVVRVSNNEIKIRQASKEVNATCETIGFKPDAKPWLMFMGMLQDPSHQYFIGLYDKTNPGNRQDYNRKIQLLNSFSKKFIEFINVNFSLSLPNDFNVFQNMKHKERAGIYEAKFQIEDEIRKKPMVDIRNLSKEATLERLTVMLKQYKKENDISKKDQLFIEINQCAEHIKKNGWEMSEKQNQSFLDLLEDNTLSDSDALGISVDIEEMTDQDKYRL